MVKGVSRRVIVIKSPDKSVFEEAIFIVRDDALNRGITGDEIVREAQKVANEYAASKGKRKRLRRLPGFVYLGAGALILAAVGIALHLLI